MTARQNQPQVTPKGVTPPFELIETRLTREDVEKRLAKYEAKYGLTSEEFYQLWLKGESPAATDTGGWVIMYEILQESEDNELNVVQYTPHLIEKNEDVFAHQVQHQTSDDTIPSFAILEMPFTQSYIEKTLAECEAKYGLTSEEFYRLWLKGEGPDTKDTGGWVMAYEILQEREKDDME